MDITRLPDEYYELYEKLLTNFANISPALQLAAFFPQWGSRYERTRVLIVGQATYGWEPSWDAHLIKDSRFRAQLIEKLRSDFVLKPDWVRKQANGREWFWKFVREIVHQLPLSVPYDDQMWPETVCWTNVAKIAPATGGNPHGEIWRLQQNDIAQLLRIEIDALRPSFVIMLCGKHWYADAIKLLKVNIRPTHGWAVENVGRRGDQHWVLCKHPRQARRSAVVFANEIVGCLKASGAR